MKASTSLTLIILTIILNPSIQIIQSCTTQHASYQEEHQLIHQTCKKTPYYKLCLSTLLANPKSTTADVEGLALIMVDNIKARALALVQNINKLQSHEPAESDTNRALKFCGEAYNAVIVADVPEAVAGLTKGDYKFAEDGAKDAAMEVESCESKLGGKVPQLSGMNKELHDVSLVTSAIVRILL